MFYQWLVCLRLGISGKAWGLSSVSFGVQCIPKVGILSHVAGAIIILQEPIGLARVIGLVGVTNHRIVSHSYAQSICVSACPCLLGHLMDCVFVKGPWSYFGRFRHEIFTSVVGLDIVVELLGFFPGDIQILLFNYLEVLMFFHQVFITIFALLDDLGQIVLLVFLHLVELDLVLVVLPLSPFYEVFLYLLHPSLLFELPL